MRRPNPSLASPTQRGLSLIELMVAMVLGLFLIFGAVTVYTQSRKSYVASESLARLQEVGRLAMDVLETDVRMASYWGLNNNSIVIANRAAPGQGTIFSAAQEGRIDACGGADSNWGINLDEYIAASNNGYGLSCAAQNEASDASDVVVVRRASDTAAATMDVNRIYLQTSRTQGALFMPTAGCLDTSNPSCIPGAFAPPLSQTRLLEVKAYYVDNESTLRDDVPALRRKSLGNINANPGIVDEEIVSGIEDLQIQLGVDTNGDTNVDDYVDPDDVAAGDSIVAATIWIRVRSEDRDFGHVDGNTYEYADIAFTPGDNYRRLVLSKTIQLRNIR